MEESMYLTPEEKETIIRIDEAGKMASIYTASERVKNHLERAGLKPMKIHRGMKDKKPCGWEYEVPRWAVRVKPGG